MVNDNSSVTEPNGSGIGEPYASDAAAESGSGHASGHQPDPEQNGQGMPAAEKLPTAMGRSDGERATERSNYPAPDAVAPESLERLQRIVSAPWLQSYAAANLPLAQMGDSVKLLHSLEALNPQPHLIETINQMLKASTPDFSHIMEAASLPLTQMLQPASISGALKTLLENSLRHSTFAGFATKTQEWLTTTETLRYRSNNYVWHYTNGYACLSIIKSGSLWASSPESLNDASEMTHGLTLIREGLERLLVEAKEEGDYDPDDWATVELLMKEVLDDAYFDTMLNEVYFISASSQPDSLTLWRNYANGDGFALGLSTSVELSADGIAMDGHEGTANYRADVPPISGWYRVVYKKRQKERLATEFIQSAVEDIDRAGESDHETLVKELRKQAVILASVMKHDAFEDEKEVRWMTTNFTNFDPVHYEHGRTSIVPVLHVRAASQDGDSLLPLRGVGCSPVAPDGIVRTIQGLLTQMGYTRASGNVKKSEQPFRG